ncbi:MAG: DUF6288 domain-containing protein [Planctomycetota bacterium]|jgi:hypothetical protein
MTRPAVVVVCLAALLACASAAEPEAGQDKKSIERAKEFLLKNLKKAPHPSGSPHGQSTSAICGLALLILDVPTDDPVIDFVVKDITKFVDKTHEAGDRFQCNWVLGFGGLFFAELAARGRKEDEVIGKIIELIRNNQTKDGGWGHQKAPTKLIRGYPDTFFAPTNWCSAALGALARVGYEVDEKAIEEAMKLFERGQVASGGYPYDPSQMKSSGEAGRTGTAIFAMLLMGKEKTETCQKALKYYQNMMRTAPEGHSSPPMHIGSAGLASAAAGKKLWKQCLSIFAKPICNEQNANGSYRLIQKVEDPKRARPKRPQRKPPEEDERGRRGRERKHRDEDNHCFVTGFHLLALKADRLKFLKAGEGKDSGKGGAFKKKRKKTPTKSKKENP